MGADAVSLGQGISLPTTVEFYIHNGTHLIQLWSDHCTQHGTATVTLPYREVSCWHAR